MDDLPEQSRWREWLSLYSDAFGVIGGIVLILGFLLWVSGRISGGLILIPVSVAATLLGVWITGLVFVRNRDPLVSLGRVWTAVTPVLQSSAQPKLSSKQKANLGSLDELERLYELKRREPNLRFVRAGLIGGHEDENGRIVEGHNLFDKTIHAIVAEFNNRIDPKRAIGAVDEVSARVTYTFFDDRPVIEITRGVWVQEESKVNFGINDTHNLIIATLEGIKERYPYVLNGSYSGKPKHVMIAEGLVKVNVALVAEIQNREIAKNEFMLETKRDSDVLINSVLSEMRDWKQARLLDFVEQGLKLVDRHNAASTAEREQLASLGGLATLAETPGEVEEATDAWGRAVGKFLDAHMSEAHKIRLIMVVGADPKKPRAFTDYLVAGCRLLLEFVQEVRRLG